MSQQRGAETSASTSDPMPNPEPDETYRFGGGALADMLHHRYKQMKSKICTNKDRVSGEIQVLKWIQMVDSDKERLPESKIQRQRTHVFPHPKPIPFIKNLEYAVHTMANITEYKRLGKDLVEVTTAHIQKDTQLFKSFTAATSEIAMDIDDTNVSLISVYEEFSRKIYNTRLKEFIDVQKQLSVMKSGKASLSGRNLRYVAYFSCSNEN